MPYSKLHIDFMHKKTPKSCKYFLVQKICRFGEKCSYKHIDNSNQNDILELKEKIVILEKSVQFLTAQISELTDEVSNVKRKRQKIFSNVLTVLTQLVPTLF